MTSSCPSAIYFAVAPPESHMESVRPGGGLLAAYHLFFLDQVLLRWLPTAPQTFDCLAPTTAVPVKGPSLAGRLSRIDWSDRHGSRVIQNTQPAALVPRLMCNLVFCCRSAVTHHERSPQGRKAEKRQQVGLRFAWRICPKFAALSGFSCEVGGKQSSGQSG